MNVHQVINAVPEYSGFYNVDELNARARENAFRNGFKFSEVGKSLEGRPIYIVEAGDGKKNLFLWGFPHPNEPIGAMLIDFLISHLKNYPHLLEDYTWYLVPCIDPDGARLNEGWFKGKLTLEKYFLNWYRQPSHRMIDWTFPIEYKDFIWNKPLDETQVLMKLINEIKPDLMYPLHNSGFGGAYFFSTKKFSDEYYDDILREVASLGIPLHLGEPEEPFMVAYKKPFYDYFGFKDYYDYSVKIGRDGKKLEHGDNSPNYLRALNHNAVTICGEVPYFYAPEIQNESGSEKTRREVWIDYLDALDKTASIVKPIIPEIMKKLKAPNPYFYIAEASSKRIGENGAMRKEVMTSKEYDRLATMAEVFEGAVSGKFFATGLPLGQIRRAVIEADLSKSIVDNLTLDIERCAREIESVYSLEVFPIRKVVQLQLMYLLKTLEEIKHKQQ